MYFLHYLTYLAYLACPIYIILIHFTPSPVSDILLNFSSALTCVESGISMVMAVKITRIKCPHIQNGP